MDWTLDPAPDGPPGVVRPTHVVVDLARLVGNFATIRAHVGGRAVMPILKANAYGHGLVPVARALEAAGAPCFGVAVLEEGLVLRQAGVRVPILVLGGIVGEQIPLFLDAGLSLTASSIDKLRAIDAAAAGRPEKARVHLKIDTGMGRIGVRWSGASRLIEESLRCTNVAVEGVYTHLATSDEAEPSFTRTQLARFAEALDAYARLGAPCPPRHAAATGGILQHPDSWLDLVRPGLLLYGVHPSADFPVRLPVQPALSWTSKVVFFKVVLPGESVSYGATWRASEPTRVVTVPVGYGDGYLRALGAGGAEVLLRGQRRPVIGRVCMDQLMVSVGWGEAWNGDEVVLLGEQGGCAVRAEELAARAGTIPWEILTAINARVPRLYTGGPPAAASAAASSAGPSGPSRGPSREA
jgi:alanine racemase